MKIHISAKKKMSMWYKIINIYHILSNQEKIWQELQCFLQKIQISVSAWITLRVDLIMEINKYFATECQKYCFKQ